MVYVLFITDRLHGTNKFKYTTLQFTISVFNHIHGWIIHPVLIRRLIRKMNRKSENPRNKTSVFRDTIYCHGSDMARGALVQKNAT